MLHLSRAFLRSFMLIRKSRGPKVEPSGTPHLTVLSEKRNFLLTDIVSC